MNSSEFKLNSESKTYQIAEAQGNTQAGTRVGSAVVVLGGVGLGPNAITRGFNKGKTSVDLPT
jgi:hypothetical protein